MKLIRSLLLGSVVFFTAGIQGAQAMPLGAAEQAFGVSIQSPGVDPILEVDFTAIVALSNCSGSLVRFQTSLPADHAMVLTNAHCLGLPGGFLGPGKVVVNEPVTRTFKLLKSNAQTLATLNAQRVVFATLTQTDMAVYELKETFDDIEKKYSVTALTLSSSHPYEGQNISIASGYWKKIYTCAIDRFIYEMREDEWTWKDSIRYTTPGCEVIGGTSGSPIIDSDTHEVVGVNNTGNESGKQCTMNNPCEVDAEGNITVVRGGSYGQQTFWLYGCLDSSNQLQLDKPGCQLPKNHSAE